MPVLLAVRSVDGHAYNRAVWSWVRETFGADMTEMAITENLHKLADEGLIRPYRTKRDGRRTCWAVTVEGEAAFQQWRQAFGDGGRSE